VGLVLAAAPRRRGVALAGASALLVALAFQLVPSRLFEGKFIERFGKVVYYREEVTDTVMVTEDEGGGRVIRYGDGRGTAGTITYMEDRMYAHIPMLLHPDPRSVLQIGYGVGNTLSAVAQHPVERIDCVELSPGVIEASPFFDATNRDVLADPRVRHTREFYEMARDHLAEGGVFSIWVNIVMTPVDDLRMLIRTIADVFPHVSVWHTPQFYSWVINGSLVPRPPDLELIAKRFEQPEIRADLESIHIDDPVYFLKYFMFGGDEVADFTGPGPLVTDDRTYLDFTVPRSKDSFYGISNMNTGTYLVQLMDPGTKRDVATKIFLRKVGEALTFKRPVVPHVVNIEAAGFDRTEVSARVAAPFEANAP
jgi:spermidine synthase